MASIHPEKSEHFPKIQKQGFVEAKSSSQLTFLEDPSSDVREMWRDHGNERQRYRNSPPTIGFRRASAENSRTNSPVQKRFEGDHISTPPRMSPASISLDLGSSLDETQLLRDKISRLQQDRDHLMSQLSHYRQTAENAQTDLAAEKVANGSLQKELQERKQKLSEKDQEIMELKCEIESDKQSAARQTALIQSLRQRVREAEDEAEEKETVVSRNDITLASLRKELQIQQDRLQQAESSLKHHIMAGEEAAMRSSNWESKFGELQSNLASALSFSGSEVLSIPQETLLSKVSELSREHQALHEKVSTLTRNLHESNMESKASRETIMRLVAEVGTEKKATEQSQQAVDGIRRERDLLQQKVRESEIEVEKLKVQLASSQEAWGHTKKELDDKVSRLTSLESDLQSSHYTGQTSQAQLQNFRRHLSQLLSNLGDPVESQEDQIVSKVNELLRRFQQLKLNSESLKTQIRNLSDEIESQRNLHRTTLKRASEAESQLKEWSDRVNGLEGELLTSDVERDRLKDDKKKFVAFCEKLARAMRLNEIADDAGLDVNGEAILARAEQLVKLEADALDDRKTTIYNLQRKVKWAKQQIESKELTIGLLRKKVGGLEELVRDKGRLEAERDDNSFRFKKVLKHNEKLQRELLEYKQQVTNLKSRLLEASELKVKTLEQYKTIEDLEQAVNKLAKSKQKTVLELKEIKNELDAAEFETRENKAKSDVTMQQIASELLTTKQALEESRTREKQLLDFRQVLARLLGLNIETLSVPDYEIISRLERLVQAHHAHSITTHSLETSLQDMESGFRAGFDDAVAILRTPSPLKMK